MPIENFNNPGVPRSVLPMQQKTSIDPTNTYWRTTISTIAIILLAPVIAFFLTAFVFQQYQVDGPSMQPTLQNGNRLIVLKIARTWSRITGHPYIPKRTDIVIFNENKLYTLNPTGSDQLIKRVVGLPGERIVVKDNVLTIYNKDNPSGFEPDKTLSYGKVITETTGDLDITVPPNQVFVCGDNRDNSLDSRVFGTVPVSDIIGKLVLRITPLTEVKSY